MINNLTIKTKVCNKCGKEKLKSEFHVNRDKPDGLDYRCKQCVKLRDRKRHQERGELLNTQRSRRYYRAKVSELRSIIKEMEND